MTANNSQEYHALVEMENLKTKFQLLELENQSQILRDLQKVTVEKQQQQDESTIVALQQQIVEGQGIIGPKISLPAKFDGSRVIFRVF